jgi:hypothetical protein
MQSEIQALMAAMAATDTKLAVLKRQKADIQKKYGKK